MHRAAVAASSKGFKQLQKNFVYSSKSHLRTNGDLYRFLASKDSLPPQTTELVRKLKQLGPPPPEPENCCGSGCANCVWFTWLEAMNDYKAKQNVIMGDTDASTLTIADLPLDPALKAFLELEMKLKANSKPK